MLLLAYWCKCLKNIFGAEARHESTLCLVMIKTTVVHYIFFLLMKIYIELYLNVLHSFDFHPCFCAVKSDVVFYQG